jgi:hypothetical protein
MLDIENEATDCNGTEIEDVGTHAAITHDRFVIGALACNSSIGWCGIIARTISDLCSFTTRY